MLMMVNTDINVSMINLNHKQQSSMGHPPRDILSHDAACTSHFVDEICRRFCWTVTSYAIECIVSIEISLRRIRSVEIRRSWRVLQQAKNPRFKTEIVFCKSWCFHEACNRHVMDSKWIRPELRCSNKDIHIVYKCTGFIVEIAISPSIKENGSHSAKTTNLPTSPLHQNQQGNRWRKTNDQCV